MRTIAYYRGTENGIKNQIQIVTKLCADNDLETPEVEYVDEGVNHHNRDVMFENLDDEAVLVTDSIARLTRNVHEFVEILNAIKSSGAVFCSQDQESVLDIKLLKCRVFFRK